MYAPGVEILCIQHAHDAFSRRMSKVVSPNFTIRRDTTAEVP